MGATSVMFEGVPSYPGPDRFWKIVEKFKVNIFYTAPTVIRALMRDGDEPTKRSDLSTLADPSVVDNLVAGRKGML